MKKLTVSEKFSIVQGRACQTSSNILECKALMNNLEFRGLWWYCLMMGIDSAGVYWVVLFIYLFTEEA